MNAAVATRPSPASAHPSGPATAPPANHRPDIDGLRAVAILLVVAFHAGVAGFSGGFIGVDVFFVLSGYLITGAVVREIDTTGSLRLGHFWLRRGRRLLAASATMTVGTLVAATFVYSPLQWGHLIDEAVASLFYWSNEFFAGRTTDYFAEDLGVSPFLHTWSLSVEEQFYILWPVVFFLVARFTDAGSSRGRSVRLGVIAGLTLLSFQLSLGLTRSGSVAAFYSATSRAWEFGAGAVLALALTGPVRSARIGRALTAFGVVILAYAVATVDARSGFPGPSALLPVLATVALIAAAPGRGPVGRFLTCAPAQTIGRLSYSWYLWHWPVMVLGAEQLGNNSVSTRVALAGASLVPAAITHRLVEQPVRFHPRLVRSDRATLGALAAIVVAAGSIVVVTQVRRDQALDEPLLAALAAARTDNTPVEGPCGQIDPDEVLRQCIGGDPNGGRRVLLLGDSHAAAIMPGVDDAAAQLGWRMTASLLHDCPTLAVQRSGERGRCLDRQDDIGPLIDAVDPDIVVVAHSLGYLGGLVDERGVLHPADEQAEVWSAALASFAAHLAERDIGLVVILDVPGWPEDPRECAARARSATACDLTAAEAEDYVARSHAAERAAIDAAGHGTSFDPVPALCARRHLPTRARRRGHLRRLPPPDRHLRPHLRARARHRPRRRAHAVNTWTPWCQTRV